tara:strand:+ start:252 stop:1691 length:1440 start_codon:yes stop_codon:yes gene_type:complete
MTNNDAKNAESPLRCAVCVLTRPEEMEQILLSHQWWSKGACPVSSGAGLESPVDLIYLFPGEFDGSVEERITDSFSRNHLEDYFSTLRLIFADLPPERNHYIRNPEARPPNAFGLKSGPNYLFFHLIQETASGYECVMQMETDCIPIRKGWLNEYLRVQRANSESWVIGSGYHGPKLPKPWTDHLNGNAIYRVSREFQDFFRDAWIIRTEGVVKFLRPEMAYDCAWEEYRNYDNGHSIRRQVHEDMAEFDRRFQVDPYIANMAPGLLYPKTIPTLEELKEELPNTYLVHGSWLLPIVRETLNVEPPAKISSNSRVEESEVQPTWFWIKGFHLSENAWFEGGSFALHSVSAAISWKFGAPALPQLNITLEQGGPLKVEVKVVRRAASDAVWGFVRYFDSKGFRGKWFYLNLKKSLRAVMDHFPWRWPRLGKCLLESDLDEGAHTLDLEALPCPLNCDILVSIRNMSDDTVEGKIDLSMPS